MRSTGNIIINTNKQTLNNEYVKIYKRFKFSCKAQTWMAWQEWISSGGSWTLAEKKEKDTEMHRIWKWVTDVSRKKQKRQVPEWRQEAWTKERCLAEWIVEETLKSKSMLQASTTYGEGFGWGFKKCSAMLMIKTQKGTSFPIHIPIIIITLSHHFISYCDWCGGVVLLTHGVWHSQLFWHTKEFTMDDSHVAL